MITAIRKCILPFAIALFSVPPAFAAPSFVCGANPAQNTKLVQDAINKAGPIATITLPPGVCVLAKCQVADPNAPCQGVTGGKHYSALYISKPLNAQLDIVGDASGTSVLKLDPNPPRKGVERHPYCGDTHLVTVEKISHVTFRGFTIDGGYDPQLDAAECRRIVDGEPKYGFSEHMHGLYLQNAQDIEIVDMRIANARGDGLNLFANINLLPLTQGINVRASEFLSNKRSGIAFQRNVSDVIITGNTFHNSGSDQDLDMESTGGTDNAGPTNIEITNNEFQRAKKDGGPASGLAVTLGAGNTQPGTRINFSDNVIEPAPGATTKYGGCVFIYRAEVVTMRNNRIVGGVDCFPVQARKTQDLTIESNTLHGYRNTAQKDENGILRFQPSGVISISAISNKVDEGCTGDCKYRAHYIDGLTIKNNTIWQHVKFSTGIDLEGADGVTISDNQIVAAGDAVEPAGTVNTEAQVGAVAIMLGVHPLKDGDSFTNYRSSFKQSWVNGNVLINFNNAVIMQRYPGISINSVSLAANSLSSNVQPAVGLYLKDESAFVTNLTVDRNRFGCGFVTIPPNLGKNAFVRPQGQAHTGDIGSAIAGNPTPCFKPSRA